MQIENRKVRLCGWFCCCFFYLGKVVTYRLLYLYESNNNNNRRKKLKCVNDKIMSMSLSMSTDNGTDNGRNANRFDCVFRIVLPFRYSFFSLFISSIFERKIAFRFKTSKFNKISIKKGGLTTLFSPFFSFRMFDCRFHCALTQIDQNRLNNCLNKHTNL